MTSLNMPEVISLESKIDNENIKSNKKGRPKLSPEEKQRKIEEHRIKQREYAAKKRTEDPNYGKEAYNKYANAHPDFNKIRGQKWTNKIREYKLAYDTVKRINQQIITSEY